MAFFENKNHHLVVDLYDGVSISQDEIKEFINEQLCGCKVSYILHDKDVNDKDGTLKLAHYHILIFAPAKIRTIALFNLLMDFFPQLDKVALNDRRVLNKYKSYLYLRHVENPEKYQYGENELYSNMTDDEIVELSKDDEIDWNTLIAYCSECDSAVQVYAKIGLKFAQRYRNIIMDIFKYKSYWNNEFARQYAIEKLESDDGKK